MQWQQESQPSVFSSLLALFEGGRGTFLAALLVPLLVGLALWLPPVSIGERIFDAGYTVVPARGGSLVLADGAQLTLPAEALSEPVKVQFATTARRALIEGSVEGPLQDAPAALPPQLLLQSDVYGASVKGAMPAYSIWTLPLPADSGPHELLDLYEWDGSRWAWLPHKLWPEDGQIETFTAGVPEGTAVMQAQRVPVQVGAITDESADFVTRASTTVSVLAPRLYLVQGDGSIGQAFTMSPIFQQSGALVWPVLHNVESSGVVRSDLVDNLLIDPNAWRQHVERIASLLTGSAYDGIIIDYRNVDPSLRNEFSSFVATLAQRLAQDNRRLVVRVGEPVRISEDDFDTGAYDWQAIGQSAAVVQVPVPRSPGFYGGSDDLDALLTFATGRVNRYNLLLELPAAPYTIADGTAQPVAYRDVMAALAGDTAPDEAPPSLDALAATDERLTFDPATGAYRATLDGQEIYLENAETLVRRLETIRRYHVGGVVVTDPNQADPEVWNELASYQFESLQ